MPSKRGQKAIIFGRPLKGFSILAKIGFIGRSRKLIHVMSFLLAIPKMESAGDEESSFDWVFPVCVASVAMVSYAVNAGLLQKTRV